MEYIVVTACRNEEETIGDVIEGVLSQRYPPTLYAVVDDGSTDESANIIRKYGVTLVSLSDGGHRVKDIRIGRVFCKGVEQAEKLVPDWKYLLKVDADCILPPTYVSSLIDEMKRNPRIGIASGTPLTKTECGYKKRVLEKTYPTDGARIYRRKCWDDIGGLYPICSFDTYATLEAERLGWKTRSFKEITYKEERFWGGVTPSFSVTKGLALYTLGYPLLYVIWATLGLIRRKPRLLGALALFFSFLFYHLTPWNRCLPPKSYAFIRRRALDDFKRRWLKLLRLF